MHENDYSYAMLTACYNAKVEITIEIRKAERKSGTHVEES
jgi:hypothetical protein